MVRKGLVLTAIVVTALSLATSLPASAQTDYGFYGTAASAGNSLKENAERWAIIAFWILSALAFLFFILSLIAYYTAYGDPEVAKKGTQRAIFALVTLIIAVLIRIIPAAF